MRNVVVDVVVVVVVVVGCEDCVGGVAVHVACNFVSSIFILALSFCTSSIISFRARFSSLSSVCLALRLSRVVTVPFILAFISRMSVQQSSVFCARTNFNMSSTSFRKVPDFLNIF